MKKQTEKLIQETLLKLDNLTRHIKNVQDNCLLLGERLIRIGEIELGRKLIANGFIHDASKFHGIEWSNLSTNAKDEEIAKVKMKLAIQQHRAVNPHHVEYWGHIDRMPDLYLCELICDISARGQESGTNIRDWLNTVGIKSYDLDKDSKTYKKLNYYLDILLDKPLEKIDVQV